jgi:hypothetical protein
MDIQYHLEDHHKVHTHELVYLKKTLLLIEFEIATLRKTSNLNLYLSFAQKERLQHLNALDEYKKKAFFHTEVVQQKRKK